MKLRIATILTAVFTVASSAALTASPADAERCRDHRQT